MLISTAWLDRFWDDELLAWDPERFSGIRCIRLPGELIWHPDLVLYNKCVRTHPQPPHLTPFLLLTFYCAIPEPRPLMTI